MRRAGFPHRTVCIAIAAALAAGSFSGCGNLSREELQRGVQSLSALAAQGRLLADGVARDRTKLTYARAMSRILSEQAQHEAEKLTDATPAPGTGPRRDRAVKIATDLAGAYSTLQTFAGHEAVGRSVLTQMRTLQNRADALDHALYPGPS